MSAVQFTVVHEFDQSPEVVWQSMIDWPSHGEWIPATRVEIDEGDPQAVGGRFTGYTGVGPLTLVDRMEITDLDWNVESQSGSCEVAKLGPVLHGKAGFSVAPSGAGARLVWFEDVTVKYLPAILAPIVNKLSAIGFSQGMKKLGNVLAKRPAVA